MNSNWNYHDIIDLEYFFQQDTDCNTSELHQRDRNIYLEHISAADAKSPHSTTSFLKVWLQDRKDNRTEDDPLPGTIAREAYNLLRLALIVTGLITGSTAGMLFFSYTGSTPVNVLHFLALFVVTQVALTLILFLRGGLITLGLRSIPHSLTTSILSTLFTRTARYLQREGNKQLSARRRLTLQANLGRFSVGRARYGELFFWPIFLLIQLGSIFFNLGLLSSTFFKVSVSDLAFGWQSTLQLTSQKLHSIVGYIALPWSWLFGEGAGYPSLEEIEGSRIILKEGISNLFTPDLVSWWPFLLLCVVFYGLFLRCALYLFGKYRAYRVSSAFQPDSPSARQVIRRMQTPVLTTQAIPDAVETEASKEIQPADSPAEELYTIQTNPIHLLIPDEIHDSCDMHQLSILLAREGFDVTCTHRFMVDYESDQKLLAAFNIEDWSNSAGIIILMEAWMPPLVSFQSYLKELRKQVGSSLSIILRLVGKPTAITTLTPIQDETLLQVWRQKIESIGDPYLEISALIDEENV